LNGEWGLPWTSKSGHIEISTSGDAVAKEVLSQVREPGPKDEGGWPSNKLRLTLLISFAGLLALMVIAGLDALRLARQMQMQEEEIRKTFLAHSQPLLVLSSSINVYNARIQEYLMSQDARTDGLTAAEISRLTADINSTLGKYPPNCQPGERALRESLRELFTEQQKMMNPVLSWSPEERHRQAWRILNEEVLPQRSRIEETSEQITLWNSQQLAATDGEMFRSFAILQARQTRLLAIALTAGLVLSLASIVYLFRLGEEAQRRYQELAESRGQLEALSSQLVDAQETERRSISRELHDEVGQSLGALLVEVGRLAESVPSENIKVRDHVDKIKSVAETTVQTVRNIALLLRPSMLDDLGLIPALEWQGREVSRSEMEVEVESSEVSEEIPDEYKICIYRIVQEALNNAARHSAAKNARVTVEQTANKILVCVSDDGRGFDPQRVRGLGILGMEERVRRLGGTFTIDSKPGGSTTLKAEFPLPQS
jgi:signal transduction histidine kinase